MRTFWTAVSNVNGQRRAAAHRFVRVEVSATGRSPWTVWSSISKRDHGKQTGVPLSGLPIIRLRPREGRAYARRALGVFQRDRDGRAGEIAFRRAPLIALAAMTALHWASLFQSQKT